MISNYCRKEREKGTKIFMDPIMGDEGHLYNGLNSKTVESMRKLISNADYMVPNYTEACLLTNTPYHPEGVAWSDMKRILGKLYMMSKGSVAVTSAKVDGKDAVAGYDEGEREFFLRTFDLIPVRFPGTGDIFSAIFMGSVMNDMSMMDSVDKAMIAVRKMIVMSQDAKDNFKGIPVEKCLEVLD